MVTGLNVAEMIGDALSTFLPEMLALIAVIAPIVIGVVMAQTGLGWGIRIFRSLTGR